MKPDLSVRIGALRMRTPVMVASGTFGYGEEYSELVDLSQLGAIVLKGITLQPKEGNPPPRICETPAGMLNAIGLQNVGVDALVSEKLPRLESLDVPVIANINGVNVEEYARLAAALDDVDRIDAIELNASCPNVSHGGMHFGTDPAVLRGLTAAVRARTSKPLIVKLSPNVTDVGAVARAAEAGGADGLSLINSVLAMAVDVEKQRPRLGNVTGGLTGPAIRPLAVRMVWQAARAVSVPIVGQGGIMKAEDALEFLLAGASAVAVGSATFVDPTAALAVTDGIREYMARHGFAQVDELRKVGEAW